MKLPSIHYAAIPVLLSLLACPEGPAEITDRPFPRHGIILEPEFPDVEPPVDARPHDALSAAAALRTGFTGALEGHTMLLALTVDAMVSGGDVELARETLDDNTFVLADYIEMVHDDGARERFYAAWTRYTDAMLVYAEVRGPDASAGEVANARRNVRAARREIVALLTDLNPLMERPGVNQSLRRWESAQLQAIDGLVAEAPARWHLVRRASRRSFVLAAEWSRPFDDLIERQGDPDDPAARIRAESVFLLEEQVYLLWFATRDGDASGALAGNLDATADLVGQAYGPNAEQQFHALWDARAMATLDYAAALGTTDEKALQQAQVDLDLASDELTELLFAFDPALDPEVIRPAFRELDEAVLEALNGLEDASMNERWDPPEDAYDDVRQTAMFAEHLATALAVAMTD